VTRQVWIDGTRTRLAPAALLGQGGEAEVYDLGDGRVVKWWKPPEHPDFGGLPDAQRAARERIASAPARLRAMPGNLPAAVVAPCGLALAKRHGDVCGYLMPRIAGTALHDYGEPRWRREHPVAGADVVTVLLALHDALAGLHRAGVVVGDCNDVDVLVDGTRVHLIDVDSYQLAGFPCSMFSERFVDPRLCGVQQLVPVLPHDEDSDWFAFAVMAFRTLLCVGPWGGVAKGCPPGARALRRHSVLASDVTYPRAARPLAILPDELLDAFRDIFERDRRGVFPRAMLERLRLRACSTCGEGHARVRCPACQAVAHVPPAVVHGRVRWQPIARDAVTVATRRVTTRGLASAGGAHLRVPIVYLEGGALMRATRLGPERVGGVLAAQTHAWVGDKLGIGFYRAAGYAVGFVFRPDHGLLDDRVVPPRLRGALVNAHAVVGDDRAWLLVTCRDGGQLVTTCVVVGADASVLASETLLDAAWLAGIGGACSAGPYLFVPTDEGVARIEVVQRTVTQTRLFAETAPLVSTADVLALASIPPTGVNPAGSTSGGLDVLRRRDAIRMHLT
jgi:hypothetical protein